MKILNQTKRIFVLGMDPVLFRPMNIVAGMNVIDDALWEKVSKSLPISDALSKGDLMVIKDEIALKAVDLAESEVKDEPKPKKAKKVEQQ